MAIEITFNSLTDGQKAEFIQLQAEIYRLQGKIEEETAKIEIINGKVREFELEIAEREKLLRDTLKPEA